MAQKRKPGAGRKTIAVEIMRHTIEVDGAEDAKYAYSLFVSKMRGQRISAPRLQAAREVLDRVLGRPKQSIAGSWQGGVIPVNLVDIDYRKDLEGGDSNATSEGIQQAQH